MPWYFPWGDSIKKKACRYILHHYLGNFLQEKLSLEQLSIDIYNGTGTINDVHVDHKTINQQLEDAGLPFEVVDGFVKTITVSIPWSSLITNDTAVEINGLELTLQSTSRDHNPDLDVSWLSQSNMTTSMQLAEECLKDDSAAKTLPEGLEAFAKTIESVLSRVKITLVDTIIRVEHCPLDSSNGIALEAQIGRIEYFDEASRDPGTSVDDVKSPLQPSAYVIKNIHISGGLSLYTDIFYPCHRTPPAASGLMTENVSPDIFLSAMSSTTQPISRQPSYICSSRDNESLPKEHSNINSFPVKFLSAFGEQRVKIKIKNDEKISGAKSILDIQLSSVGVFVSPKQVHCLSQLVSSFAQTEGSAQKASSFSFDQTEPFTLKNQGSSKLLGYHHFENVLHHQFHNQAVPGVVPGSILPLIDLDELGVNKMEDSIGSHMFQSLGDQMNSGASDMMTSSIYSSHSGTTLSKAATDLLGSSADKRNASYKFQTTPTHSRGRFDPQKSDAATIKGSIAFVGFVLLNEDPTSTTTDAFESVQTGIEKLKSKSERFFEGFSSQRHRGVIELKDIRHSIQEYCKDNHIMVIAKKLEANVANQSQQSSGRKKAETRANISVGLCEVTEWIGVEERLKAFKDFNPNPTTEILVFHPDESTPTTQSSLKISFVTSQTHAMKGGQGKVLSSVNVTLCRPCAVEVDISITDRLHDLFNPSNVFDTRSFSTSTSYMNNRPTNNDNDSSEVSSSTQFSISSELDVCLFLRFPIADLRKDPNQRLAWWRRNLREEILELQVSKLRCNTKSTTVSESSEVELSCRSIRAFFHMHGSRVPFANIGQELSDNEELEWPRLMVKKLPTRKDLLLDEEEQPGSNESLQGACSEMGPREFSPFSNLKAMFNNEELQIPGSKREMADFEHDTKANAELVIELDLPAVNVVVPNKNMFEVLYNRVCNDLILWESLAPIPSTSMNSHQLGYIGLNNVSQWDDGVYKLCKSALHDDSLESIDDANDLSDEMLYSIHNPSHTQTKKNKGQSYKPVKSSHGQSKSCVMISIKRGQLKFAHPVKDENDKERSDCYGQSALDVHDMVIYINSKSLGDPNCSYVSIHASNATLYHNGLLSGRYIHPAHIERLQSVPPPHLYKTIELCPNGVKNKLGYTVGHKGDQDMLSVAIRIALDPDPKKYIKKIVVSVALRRACLNHIMVAAPEFWLNQLIEAVAVDDYDVLGYPFPKVITELHLHIIGSAISYIPRNLPLKGLVTFEKFSLSSNVIANSPVSLLRFLVEDAALYLSSNYQEPVLDVSADYACLSELSHFQLDLRKSDGNNLKYPCVDLNANCSALHIKTCADSLKALHEFIDFLADNGDLPPPNNQGKQTNSLDDVEDSSDDNSSISDYNEIPNLMSDAMEDPSTTVPKPVAQERQIYPQEMFLFPDENNKAPFQLHSEKREGEGQPDSDADTDSCDSLDFCVVDYPNIPTEGEPVIETVDNEPLKISEDFFNLPNTKVDLLNPPRSFPSPVYKYCLSDLTVVWDIYGGDDFGPSSQKKQIGSRKRGSLNGNRDLDKVLELQLSKVRIHHEIYSDNAPQVSRLCLLVQDLEVRDRLVISDVNKLLYQYTSDKMPRQQHTSIISIKSVTHRPDVSKPAEEMDIRVSLQPLRVNIDQDTLLFIQSFIVNYTGVGDSQTADALSYNATDQTISGMPSSDTQRDTLPAVDLPIMSISTKEDNDLSKEEGKTIFDEIDGGNDGNEKKTPSAHEVFIKSFIFTPEVPIRLDYVGKHIDIEQRLQGLLIGLAQLNKSELRLKSLHFRQGILGTDKLVKACTEEWKRDIVRYQIPAILGGVGPLSSFVQFFHGVQDLVWLPIEQYRKDGRIVRGLQKGANAFSTSTTVAFIELMNRAVQSIQSLAEISFDLVSTNTKPKVSSSQRRSNPRDIREGVTSAYKVLSEGVRETAKNVVTVAARETEAKGLPGAVGGVVRQIPSSLIQPVILATDATSHVLSGLRNQLHPDAHREDLEKWK